MLISQKLKESNIAEYILYMWQVEDSIRALNHDIEQIDRIIIRNYDHPSNVKREIRNWYEQVIRMMVREDIRDQGHLKLTTDIIRELSSLHQSLLQENSDEQYKTLMGKALPFINEFQEKSGANGKGVIETCMNGLYALLLLRLQKKKVNQDTKEAMESFRNLISYLSAKYREGNHPRT